MFFLTTIVKYWEKFQQNYGTSFFLLLRNITKGKLTLNVEPHIRIDILRKLLKLKNKNKNIFIYVSNPLRKNI